ncbi:MAG: protein kinase [Planctomycetaceae bacterium]
MEIQQQCFDNAQFSRFLDNQADPAEEARIVAHIATCEQCQGVLEKLAGQPEVWNDIRTHLVENELATSDLDDENESERSQRDLNSLIELLGPTDDPSMLGRLAGYEVCGMIGRGSAGLVVKALDPRLNRYVAIKLLAPVFANNGSARQRFEREGRAIASVKDVNVIPVYSVGEYQGTPYIVMQYLPDGSLQQRIDRTGPLTASEVVCVAMQIAKGLAAAHKRGVVHRDVKPANVLLESGVDCAMVTDFGLARVLDETTMTRSGGISGTPQYMSPEQAEGESVDPRTDLFSLGSVMYAACTGHSPFRAETVFGVIKRVCESVPRPIREANPEIPEWLAAFIEKLHAKRKEDRFETADKVAEILAQELAHLQAPTMVPEPSRDWWVKPQSAPAFGLTGKRALLGSGISAVAITIGAFAWSGLGGPFDGPGGGGGQPTVVNSGQPDPIDPMGLLALTVQQNEKMPRFKNSIDVTIDVQDGGRLFLRSNLGSVKVKAHDKPTVELSLVHTVAAKDAETAAVLHRALKMNYELTAEELGDTKLQPGKDAVIIAKFPKRQLTQEEIANSDNLEELKEQLLVRNNSHYRNATFELRVPKKFSIDLQSGSGPVKMDDLDGSVAIVSHGGKIDAGNVTGEASLVSHGGHVVVGNCASANLESHGGSIEIGNVNGRLVASSHGGSVRAGVLSGTAEIESRGGSIEVEETMAATKATSGGGRVTIWKAAGPVEAQAKSGTVAVNFVRQPNGDSVLKAGSGSVRVGYVKGLSFDITASSRTGRVYGPFVEKKQKSLAYQLNDANSKLQATAGVGSVRFKVIDEQEIETELTNRRTESAGRRAFNKAYDLHMEGQLDEAIEAHKHAATFKSYKGIATYNIGCAWALKGDKEKAFARLNDAIDFGFVDFEQFESDEDLNSLRKDARFSELMSKLRAADRRPDMEKRIEDLTKAGLKEAAKQIQRGLEDDANDCDSCPSK